jgi:hypothetical protein
MWRYRWLMAHYDRAPPIAWPVLALLGTSLVLLGVLIVLQPALLALWVAALLIAGGLGVLGEALLSAWAAWQARPRRIRLRAGR